MTLNSDVWGVSTRPHTSTRPHIASYKCADVWDVWANVWGACIQGLRGRLLNLADAVLYLKPPRLSVERYSPFKGAV